MHCAFGVRGGAADPWVHAVKVPIRLRDRDSLRCFIVRTRLAVSLARRSIRPRALGTAETIEFRAALSRDVACFETSPVVGARLAYDIAVGASEVGARGAV